MLGLQLNHASKRAPDDVPETKQSDFNNWYRISAMLRVYYFYLRSMP